MIKRTTSFAWGMASLLLASCAEGDPKKVYNLPDEPQITGPRILKTVHQGNNLVEEYQSSHGVMYTAKRSDIQNGAIVKSQNITVSYLDGKMSKIVVSGLFSGISSIGRAEIIPQYDATTGYISSITQEVYEGVAKKYREVSTVEYDTEGKPNVIYKVHSVPTNIEGVYRNTQKIYENLHYAQGNISAVETVVHTINETSGTITATAKTTTAYTKYDWRYNPYKTISTRYLLLMANLMPEYYYGFSANNATEKVITASDGTQTKTSYVYDYDRQGYPTSDGIRKYTYQSIP